MAFTNLTIPDVIKFKNDINNDIDKCVDIMKHDPTNCTDYPNHDDVKSLLRLVKYYYQATELYKEYSFYKKSDTNSDEELVSDPDIFTSDSDDITGLFHNKTYRQDQPTDLTKILGLSSFDQTSCKNKNKNKTQSFSVGSFDDIDDGVNDFVGFDGPDDFDFDFADTSVDSSNYTYDTFNFHS